MYIGPQAKDAVVTDATNPIHGQHGRAPLHRDGQQWILDYLIQETGKTYHFQGEGRGALPRGVRSHAMISKHLGRQAAQLEAMGRNEEAAGHSESALDYYFQASNAFARAQHPIFSFNDEKRYLYEGVRRCYDRVIALAPYPLEHVDIPWNGSIVSGLLHIAPGVDAAAPLVFHIPGCDVTKESWPHPYFNQAHQRGMHVFSFDGPGQAESTMRGIKLEADNYEAAASTALDHLIERPEIDPERIVLYPTSFGTFWGLRLSATDPRIRATAGAQATICEKFIQTDLESPRWKQLFAFLTGAESEEQLDELLGSMTMEGYMEKITSPTLLTVGEFDPRCPLEELYPLFDQLRAPAELWVMDDQHHSLSVGGGPTWARASHGVMLDWLRDRLSGAPVRRPGQVVWVDGRGGPNDPQLKSRRHWFE
jgi:dipeptidyl aminopeptidase/acylaminoacyl peptidase